MTSDIAEDDKLNCPDDTDRASEITLRANADAWRAAGYRCNPEWIPDGAGGRIVQVPDANGVYPILHCVECEDPIPPARIKLGRIKCVACQSLAERKR
jgi:hypothetical protein